MRYYKINGNVISTIGILDYPEITKEEYDAEIAYVVARKKVQAQTAERTRPFTAEEVTAMLIKQQINTLSVDDATALRMLAFYPEWASDTDYTAGYKVQRSGKLWRCLQDHTSQDGWEPESAPSLWAKVLIPDETVIPEWEQPDSTNPYMTGDKVAHNGKTWVSAVDNNVWEPGVYGWIEQSD